MIKKIFLCLAVVFMVVLFAAASRGEEKSSLLAGLKKNIGQRMRELREKYGKKPSARRTVKKPGPLTKEERADMIEDIERHLESHPDITGMIPGLAREEKEEKVEYLYSEEKGKPKKLNELSDEALSALAANIGSKAVVMNADRINSILRQQEQVRRLQNMQRQNVPFSVPQPPQPPPRPVVPSVPRVPQTERR